jgi:predicted dehydrogenase
MDTVRLGVLGAGNIAAMNVRGYLEDPRCDVVAVCDTDEEVGRRAAKEWGAESVYANLDDLLADDSVDAVEILTPTHMHHDHVIAALEAGKHVSVQKPVANSVEDALEMGAVADRVGRTLRISECFVHYPPLELAKKLVRDGAIGKPTGLRIRTLVGQTDSAFQASLRPEGYGWRLDKRSPGGHLFDDMVHKYAMALWLLDLDITSVQAVVRRRDLFFEPCAVIFEYEDPDVLGMMEVQYSPNFYMRSSYYGADEFFEITGDEGQIWVTRATGEMLDLAPVMLFTGTAEERKTTEFTEIDADWGSGFVRSSQHFVNALIEGGRGHRRAAPVLRGLRGRRHPFPRRPPRHHRHRQPSGLGGVVGLAPHSQGGRPTSIRANDDRTVPNLGSPSDHCRLASDTSSRPRATKFHHMKTGSGNGTPPRSSALLGPAAASASSSRPSPR